MKRCQAHDGGDQCRLNAYHFCEHEFGGEPISLGEGLTLEPEARAAFLAGWKAAMKLVASKSRDLAVDKNAANESWRERVRA